MSAHEDVVRTARTIGRVCITIGVVGVVAAVLGAYVVGGVAVVLGVVGFSVTQYLVARYS